MSGGTDGRRARRTPSACSRSRSTSGIAEPDRAVSSVRVRHRELPRPAAAARATAWYEGGGAVGDRAVQGITIYPPTRGVADAGRPVRAGEDRRPRRHGPRPAPGRLDRPHDPRHRGRPQRGRVQPGPDPARDRRRPRPAPGELPQGARRLPLAGRAGLRRRARADDQRQLARRAGPRQRAEVAVHRLDRRPPVRLRLLLHGRQRRHPDRGRDVRPVARAPRASRRSACSGSRARRAATTPTTSATPRCSSASRSCAR